MEKPRKFKHEFKQKAVQLVTQDGAIISQVPRELEIKARVLERWCNEHRREGHALCSDRVQ